MVWLHPGDYDRPVRSREKSTMHVHVKIAAVLAALLMSACAGQSRRESAAGPDDTPPYSIERHRDQRKVVPGISALVIDNPYGEIQVRQTSAGELAIQAIEQRIGEKPRIARLEWFHEGDRQGFRVRYDEHDPETGGPADPRLGRVDLVGFVPPGIPLELRTDFGAQIVRRIDNDVTARSRTGRITVTARGVINITSESGEVRAWNMGYDWPRPSLLRSGGTVMADVPLFTGLDLQVSAHGEIRSDFPLDQLEQDAEGVWRARHRTGAGTSVIRISSGGAVLLQGQRTPLPGHR